ncbi:MAG: aminotransferase class V-fold PLP-dependent enzyme [Lachnospiraceae bacterium]|nr:aminotransferase class V-fold PLP-dependent enzyme [Lachnospiraceae bacterium]
MLNFTMGPVMCEDYILEIGSRQVPYFRNDEFGDLLKENERNMNLLMKAPEGARTVFLTGSGTAGMEAAVANTLDKNDRVLVINGGTFGERFVKLCRIHEIPYEEIRLERGCDITAERLAEYDGKGFTALLVNMNETATGTLYDMKLISDHCRRNGLLLIVDAISAFLADPLDMEELGADVIVTASQKALALPPGISALTLSERALNRIEEKECRMMYLDIGMALKDGLRGQTPFTPAVAILLQLNARLRRLVDKGVDEEVALTAGRAEFFRESIKDLPLTMVSHSPSNAVTALHPLNGMKAVDIVNKLKDEYGIWVAPSGGDLAEYMFRVGHIGHITDEDMNVLLDALREVVR